MVLRRETNSFVKFAAMVWLSGAVWGCVEETFDLYETAILENEPAPVWPVVEQDYPECSTTTQAFVPADVLPATGLVRFDTSAQYQPLAYEEVLLVKIFTPSSEALDVNVQGPLSVDGGEGVTVLSVGDIIAGQAEVLVRYDQPGKQRIRGWLAEPDGRSGQLEVEVYLPQVPVWQITIDPADLALITDNPSTRIYVPIELLVSGTSYPSEMRLHGGSSRSYPKKSYRIDLDDGALEDGSNHIILRAEWRDKSLLRNYLGLEMFRAATWLPTPKATLVHLRINRRYYGVMWHVERIDGDFLRSRGLNTNASMYEADPAPDFWQPGGNLTPLPSIGHYMEVYDHKKGDLNHDDLIELIEQTLQLPMKEFSEEVIEEIDVDSVLVYLAGTALLQNHDWVKKNYYLYRDLLGVKNRWFIIPWDLDITFGHLWSEDLDILGETLFFDGHPYFGAPSPGDGIHNQLARRLWQYPELDERYWQFVDHLMATVFRADFFDPLIDNILCRAAPELISDKSMRASLDEYLMRVDEVRTFVDERRRFIGE